MEKLSDILTSLSHLNLQEKIIEKQAHPSCLGGSCDVYEAWSTKHGKKVAVKHIRVFLKKDPLLAKRLAKEIRIWAKLEHENVLPLLGYFTEGSYVMPSLVSEWMGKGTLYDFMKTFLRGGINACTVLRDIASGLAYLHSKEVIHADLKTQNILISASETPLIADFGLSLALSQSNSITGMTTVSTKGTVRWMAIELLPSVSGDEPSKHDKKSDMWAFGMVIYEILTWDVPYHNMDHDVLVLMAIVNGETPDRPENAKQISENYIIFSCLWDLASSCWRRQSESRPTAEYIANHLTNETISSHLGLTPTPLQHPRYEFHIHTTDVLHFDSDSVSPVYLTSRLPAPLLVAYAGHAFASEGYNGAKVGDSYGDEKPKMSEEALYLSMEHEEGGMFRLVGVSDASDLRSRKVPDYYRETHPPLEEVHGVQLFRPIG